MAFRSTDNEEAVPATRRNIQLNCVFENLRDLQCLKLRTDSSVNDLLVSRDKDKTEARFICRIFCYDRF